MASAEIAALDVVDSTHKNVVMAITCNTIGGRAWQRVVERAITASDSGRVVHSAHLIHS